MCIGASRELFLILDSFKPGSCVHAVRFVSFTASQKALVFGAGLELKSVKFQKPLMSVHKVFINNQ
jgi:hypothetical protein